MKTTRTRFSLPKLLANFGVAVNHRQMIDDLRESMNELNSARYSVTGDGTRDHCADAEIALHEARAQFNQIFDSLEKELDVLDSVADKRDRTETAADIENENDRCAKCLGRVCVCFPSEANSPVLRMSKIFRIPR
jgi:hypothetical protein